MKYLRFVTAACAVYVVKPAALIGDTAVSAVMNVGSAMISSPFLIVITFTLGSSRGIG